jgi:hypothetical protein
MSVIKTRTRGKRLVKHRTRLDQENNETLYAQVLIESTEYVSNEVADTVLANDKDFVRRRADHPQSCVPRPVVRHVGEAPRAEPTSARPLGSTGVPSFS